MEMRLDIVEGPRHDAFVLPTSGSVTLGRSTRCELRTPELELSISREHCRFTRTSDGVQICDLGSRHGTYLNDRKLMPQEETPLRAGDLLRIGPWTMRLATGAQTSSIFTLQDSGASHEMMVAVGELNRESINRRRLELLLDCAKRLQSVENEQQLAELVVEMLQDATGFSVVAFIKPELEHDQIVVQAVRSDSFRTDTLVFSRSLIKAAAAGQAVKLRRGMEELSHTVSLAGVQTCMCVPIMGEAAMSHCLYLDCREGHMRIQDDAAAFCQAVADLCSLTLISLRRADAERQRTRLNEQMSTAATIQQAILPPTSGRVQGLSYRMHVEPGRYIAGDLFDIFAIDDRRVAMLMGDVSGKGVPAAMIAALTQSYLTAVLRNTGDLQLSMGSLNKHLAVKMPDNAFVSLFAAVIDTGTGRMEYIDAGHGYWLVRSRQGALAQPENAVGGLPLRVSPEDLYQVGETILTPGCRVIVFSDGVVEQRPGSSGGHDDEFGMGRVIETLRDTGTPDDDVISVLKAVRRHASRGEDTNVELADDVTIASVLVE